MINIIGTLPLNYGSQVVVFSLVVSCYVLHVISATQFSNPNYYTLGSEPLIFSHKPFVQSPDCGYQLSYYAYL